MSLFEATIHIHKPQTIALSTPPLNVAATGMSVGKLLASSPPESWAALLCELQRLDESEALRVSLPCAGDDLNTILTGGDAAKELCRRKPGLWNALAYEREWLTHPEYNDFMQPDSPVHGLKTFQSEIYETILAPQFSAIGACSRVLDAGAGVGRMAPALARTGARLDLADSSPRALSAAWRTLCANGVRDYDLHLRDAHDLSCFTDGTFELCLSLEVLCYLDAPQQAANELARTCKLGGYVVFSVENKLGAVLGDENLSSENIDEILETGELTVPGYCHVKYFTRESAAALAESAGLRILSVRGCHFTADGPFGRLATESALADTNKKNRLHIIERFLEETENLDALARAWLVVAFRES